MDTLYARYAAWRSWLDGFPGVAFGQYEGGYSPDYGGDAEINTFRAAQKNWPGLYNLTMENYMTFEQTYDGIYSSELNFSGTNNAWAILDPSIYVTPDPPHWTAAMHYNTNKRRFRITASVS